MIPAEISSACMPDKSLSTLVELCRTDLRAEEVWLFGSRARGDFHDDSDWDVMAIIDDNAPDDMTDPMTLWQVKKRVDLSLDLLAVKKSDFLSAQNAVTTLSHEVKREGVRLDV
ncbi:MAG: nucleotidyltransferase domain-containing protein [Boseongicola sp. SB0662_bin_57]|nr:nucleotidyltransferase domain-containing protein [Boseongicola sp. SB0662_bin_57]